LTVVDEWHPFDATTQLPGAFAVDASARMGWAFSGDASTADQGWNHVAAVSLLNGRRMSRSTSVPTLQERAPLVVDPRRHLVVYAENQIGGVQPGAPFAPKLVGIAVRHGAPGIVFRIASPLGFDRIAGLALDETGDDLFVLGTGGGSFGVPEAGSAVVELQRLSLDSLVAQRSATRWTSAYRVPSGQCPALIQVGLPVAVLVVKDSVLFGCRGSAPIVSVFVPNSPLLSGIMTLHGATRAATPSITVGYHPMPGNFAVYGETVADQATHRLVAIDVAGLVGIRVYDALHERFVGRIFAGSQHINALLTSPATGRLYFASADPTVGLGESDLAALVPTQGAIAPDALSNRMSGHPLRMAVDDSTHRIFVPAEHKADDGTTSYSLLVLADRYPRYRQPEALDYDAGAADIAEAPGRTDTTRSAVAEGFGADYQLIGGTANFVQNTTGVDPGGQGRPGSRYLRQAVVRSASLTADGALAVAVAGREDDTTSADRQGAGAGDSFAPIAQCTDFGASPMRQPLTVQGAQVLCDLEHQKVLATSSFTSQGAIATTGQGEPPATAPVQSSSSGVSLVEQRIGRIASPLTVVATAFADNVTIAGVVRIGRVTSTLRVSSSGRAGRSVAMRTVAVSHVVVGGTPLCSSVCPLPDVVAAVNAALGSRGHVEFPAADVIRTPHGTYAQVRQDPWLHAERVLDYDKADDDYAVPAMTVVAYYDGLSKSRLVADFAGLAAATSYRIFTVTGRESGEPTLPGYKTPVQPRGGLPAVGVPPAHSPSVQLAQADSNSAVALARSLRLFLRDPRSALPLLIMLSLLALPEYLSARRRLLLELPLLRREVPAP
jgi:hypothetical protein